MPRDVGILQGDAVEQGLMQVEKDDCIDVLYVVYVDERLKDVEVVEYVLVGYGECVDGWLDVVEDVVCMQVDKIDGVDEGLEGIGDLDVDCNSILDVGLGCCGDDVEGMEVKVETDAVVEC